MNAKASAGLSKPFRLLTAVLMFFLVFVLGGTSGAEDIEDHIIRTETGFYYTVQKGDTLWDLSQKFSDSPWQWPDLWHQNQDIPNPHLIYPGQRIRIYKKSFAEEKKPEEKAEEKEPEKEFFTFSRINSVGFIKTQPAPSSGTLFQSLGDKWFISQNDRVYIRPEAGTEFSPGDTFFLHRTISPVRDPDTGQKIGVQHLLTGIVEILEEKQNLAIGRIMASFREIHEGDRLMAFMPRREKFELKPGVEDLEGKIIKSEEGWSAMGEHLIAFIDKGKNHGVEVGHQYEVLYPVMEKTDARSVDPEELEREEVGSVVVLHTEDETSTVLITESRQDLSQGMPVQAMRR